jgi:hypothetical protein
MLENGHKVEKTLEDVGLYRMPMDARITTFEKEFK